MTEQTNVPASAADGAAILALAASYVGKYHDGADVPALAQFVGQAFPDLAEYDKQATATMSWCGDFMGFLFAHFGIRPPPVVNGVGYFYVDRWLDFGTPVAVGQEQPGDVAIYLNKMHHVTLVAGGGYYIGGNQSDGVTRAQYRAPDAIRRPPAIAGTAAPALAPVPVAAPALIGASASGKGSWYSWIPGDLVWGKPDPGDAPSSNALGVPDACQGISFFNHATIGHWFEVTAPNGVKSIEQQTEIGPDPNTGRTIDISAALAKRFGYTPATFPTDAVFTWQPVAAPAAVASLSPQQQAIQYASLRKGQPMTTTDQAQPSPQIALPPPAPDPAAEAFKQWARDELKKVAQDGIQQAQANPDVIAAAVAAAVKGLQQSSASSSLPSLGSLFSGQKANLSGAAGMIGLALSYFLPALGTVAPGSATSTAVTAGSSLLLGAGVWGKIAPFFDAAVKALPSIIALIPKV